MLSVGTSKKISTKLQFPFSAWLSLSPFKRKSSLAEIFVLKILKINLYYEDTLTKVQLYSETWWVFSFNKIPIQPKISCVKPCLHLSSVSTHFNFKGKRFMFTLSKNKQEQRWVYSTLSQESVESCNVISCSKELKCKIPDWRSHSPRLMWRCLFQVIRRPPEEAGPILKVEPLSSMIFDKWNRYSMFYFVWGALYVMYMTIFTACAIHRNVGKFSLFTYSTLSFCVNLSGTVPNLQ